MNYRVELSERGRVFHSIWLADLDQVKSFVESHNAKGITITVYEGVAK